jgi:gamma-glutamyltranspeptidase / glutathione hydrolase
MATSKNKRGTQCDVSRGRDHQRRAHRAFGRRARRFLTISILALLLLPPAPSSATTGPGSPYSLSVQALLGGEQTALYLRLSSDGRPLPEALEKVQLKAFSAQDEHLLTENLFDVPAPGGVALITRPDLERADRVDVKAHVKDGDQNELVAETRVALRPDLTVQLDAPGRVVRRQAFDVDVSITEVAGDTGAQATVSVFDGVELLATRHVAVGLAGTQKVTLTLALARPGAHTLSATVSDASPAEFRTTNNSDTAPLDVRVYNGDGAVVTEETLATGVGVDMLKAGGNAIDAAAAIQFALSVTFPHTTGIGGGSTIVVHLANGENFVIDAREKAPSAADPSMFVNRTPLNLRSQSGCAVGVPGALAAVELMLDHWGTRSLAETLQQPIQLAEDGFRVGTQLAIATGSARASTQPETRAILRQPDGTALPTGYLLKQPDLAKTFRLVAEQGSSVLYEGEIAPALVAVQKRTLSTGCEGRMTLADLAAYEPKVTKPISARYRGYDVVTAGPSSAGGVVLLQALRLMERFPLGDAGLGYGPLAGKTLNVMIDALRLALADRDLWLGDDDPAAGYPVPVECLLSDEYTALRSGLISASARIALATAGDPCASGPGVPVEFEDNDSAHTTHFSVVDKWGNMVSFTTTMTDEFGTGITVPGYGFALNDSLANFNLTPVGGPGNPGVNDAGPNKRARGNTAPVLVFKDGEPLVAAGSPGGGFIPSIVLQVVSNVIDQGMSIQQAVGAPRFWLQNPANVRGTIAWNPTYPAASIEYVRALGQNINLIPAPNPTALGSAQSLAVDPITYALSAASDPRARDGSAVVLP